MSDQDNLASAEERPASAGLYVDTENLGADAQPLIANLVEDWPDKFPPLARLALYVNAESVELWRLWAAGAFPNLEVRVSGIQRFSKSSSKNSADMAIATKAMVDFIRGHVNHIVVFSDDSDFVSLYAAIRDESVTAITQEMTPFSWIVTDRRNTLSAMVKQAVPQDMLHVVNAASEVKTSQASSSSRTSSNKQAKRVQPTTDESREMIQALLERIPIGKFRSPQCQKIIQALWPNHRFASMTGASFGSEFKNSVWPLLQGYGVKMVKQSPPRYEMTQQAKQGLRTT